MHLALTFMKVAACLLVGLDAHSRAIARSAAHSVFPQTALLDLNTLEEAFKYDAALGGELLVLANPDNDSIARAVEATDATGLRRWAIVVLGGVAADKGVETVSLQERGEHLLARAFRSAVQQHQLIRANQRNQGDLRTLAYRISHDLRTPLSGVLSAGEALKEVLVEHDPSSVVLTKPLFDSVDDLRKIIDRATMLARASSNPVLKRTVPMGDVIRAVLQRQERQILKKEAVVTQADSWPEVEAVFTWLEAVWENLVSNALQHGASPAQIELGWNQKEEEFRFWVSDNGGGVPEERLANLFQPFHLLHHSNARNGLGLSIVQRLVELQGGHCGYEHCSGSSSTFFFTLPANKDANVSPSSAAMKD